MQEDQAWVQSGLLRQSPHTRPRLTHPAIFEKIKNPCSENPRGGKKRVYPPPDPPTGSQANLKELCCLLCCFVVFYFLCWRLGGQDVNGGEFGRKVRKRFLWRRDPGGMPKSDLNRSGDERD